MEFELRDTLEGVTSDVLEGSFFEGWPSHPDAETHLRILQNSYAVSLAFEAETGRVVGFANAISDGVLSAYIPLLEVLPEFRGHGLGSRIIEHLVAQLDSLYMIDLVCDAELERFYAPLGFTMIAGMARRNYSNQRGAGQSSGSK